MADKKQLRRDLWRENGNITLYYYNVPGNNPDLPLDEMFYYFAEFKNNQVPERLVYHIYEEDDTVSVRILEMKDYDGYPTKCMLLLETLPPYAYIIISLKKFLENALIDYIKIVDSEAHLRDTVFDYGYDYCCRFMACSDLSFNINHYYGKDTELAVIMDEKGLGEGRMWEKILNMDHTLKKSLSILVMENRLNGTQLRQLMELRLQAGSTFLIPKEVRLSKEDEEYLSNLNVEVNARVISFTQGQNIMDIRPITQVTVENE